MFEHKALPVALELTDPTAGECFACFVAHRDLRAPRASALARRLGEMGGYCDCEVFLNGYQLADHLYAYDESGEPHAPEHPPVCGGVRRGSTQPCGNWERQRRGSW